MIPRRTRRFRSANINMSRSSLVMTTVLNLLVLVVVSSSSHGGAMDETTSCPSDHEAQEDSSTPQNLLRTTKLKPLIGALVRFTPATILSSLVVVLFPLGWRWRREAAERIEEITGGVSPLLMRRDPIPIEVDVDVDVTEEVGVRKVSCRGGGKGDDRRCEMAREINIRPAYVRSMLRRKGGGDGDGGGPDGLRVISLGRYLSSLRPAVPARGLRDEIDVLFGAALLRLLGPKLGAAVIPALGFVPRTLTAAGMGGLAAAATAAGTSGGTLDDDDEEDGAIRPSVGEGAAAAPSHVIRALGGLSLLSLSGAADSVAAILMAKKKSARRRKKTTGATSRETVPNEDGEGGDDDSSSDAGGGTTARTAVGLMWRGETAAETFPPELLPNPFVVSVHWSAAVAGMEDLLRSSSNGDGYDPDEYPRTPPKPTRDVVLPDLCLGFGDARSTHTNRQIVENRLLSVLLNRLSANDVIDELRRSRGGDEDVSTSDAAADEEVFCVRLDERGELLTRPCALIDALVESSAYTVRATRCIRNTSFGVGLCIRERPGDAAAAAADGEGEECGSDRADDDDVVKEDDDGETDADGSTPPRWIHIPLGINLRTGLHDRDGRAVPAFMTHSSVDLEIRGPVINGLVQFYQSQEGFAGWNSGHYPDVPWAVDAIEREMDAVRAVRTAGLVGSCLNSVSTRMGLPMGGYGLTGVCNDSVAVIEQALFGSTDVYPLIAIGGYYRHVIRRARELGKRMEQGNDVTSPVPTDVVRDLHRLVGSMVDLPNDVHPTPSSVEDSERRVMRCIPENPPFALMDEARCMLQSIKAEWSGS